MPPLQLSEIKIFSFFLLRIKNKQYQLRQSMKNVCIALVTLALVSCGGAQSPKGGAASSSVASSVESSLTSSAASSITSSVESSASSITSSTESSAWRLNFFGSQKKIMQKKGTPIIFWRKMKKVFTASFIEMNKALKLRAEKRE